MSGDKPMITVDKETRKIKFFKVDDDDKIWWVDYIGQVGISAVSFDKKKILFAFEDYPKNFTKEEKALFDKENPYWKKLLGG